MHSHGLAVEKHSGIASNHGLLEPFIMCSAIHKGKVLPSFICIAQESIEEESVPDLLSCEPPG